MLVLMAICGLSLSWVGNELNRLRQQRRGVSSIRAARGHTFSDYQLRKSQPNVCRWRITRGLLGDDAFSTVEGVTLLPDADFDNAVDSFSELPELKYVRIFGDRFNDKHMQFVVDNPKLRSLELLETSVTADGLSLLGSLGEFVSLRLGNTPTDEMLALLPTFSNLHYLQLNGEGVSSAGFAHLSELGQLWHLDLSSSDGVDDSVLKHLKSLHQLESLNLSHTSITDDGIGELAGLTALQSLHLDGTSISDVGVARLKQLPQIRRLSLGYCEISDDGLRHVLQMSGLNYLDLYGTDVTYEGLFCLKSLPHLRHLLIGLDLKPNELAALEQSLPNCHIFACGTLFSGYVHLKCGHPLYWMRPVVPGGVHY